MLKKVLIISKSLYEDDGEVESERIKKYIKCEEKAKKIIGEFEQISGAEDVIKEIIKDAFAKSLLENKNLSLCLFGEVVSNLMSKADVIVLSEDYINTEEGKIHKRIFKLVEMPYIIV